MVAFTFAVECTDETKSSVTAALTSGIPSIDYDSIDSFAVACAENGHRHHRESTRFQLRRSVDGIDAAVKFKTHVGAASFGNLVESGGLVVSIHDRQVPAILTVTTTTTTTTTTRTTVVTTPTVAPTTTTPRSEAKTGGKSAVVAAAVSIVVVLLAVAVVVAIRRKKLLTKRSLRYSINNGSAHHTTYQSPTYKEYDEYDEQEDVALLTLECVDDSVA